MQILEKIRKERRRPQGVLQKYAKRWTKFVRNTLKPSTNLLQEVTSMEAEEMRAAKSADGQQPFPVLLPGQLRGGANGEPIYVPAANLQVAAQSDFYRCKFMDVVVDAVMVRGKNPVTGKKGQYLKCTPPPAEKVENATAVVVQASIDAGETFFGQCVGFTYPSPTDLEDDPSTRKHSSPSSICKAWQDACDKAVAKAKYVQMCRQKKPKGCANSLPVTHESPANDSRTPLTMRTKPPLLCTPGLKQTRAAN